MAKRRFQLPGIQDLSKEQEDARALPMEGQHLIIGGPGTGKSILALLRARRLAQEDVEYVFLVYNQLLNKSTQQLFDNELASKQWNSWFTLLYKEKFGEEEPRLPPKLGKTWRNIDWDSVSERILSSELNLAAKATLVIDEGQDMPPAFYQSLLNMGFENFFVMADQNQQITDENSTREELEAALALAPADVIELTSNYRNKFPIARLAREFYPGDPASPPPKLPSVVGVKSANIPLCYEYDVSEFDGLIRRILKTADRDPSKLMGVFTFNDKDRRKYFDSLRSCSIKLDNDMPIIATFSKKERNRVNFDQGGILVINAQACKGLEFDTVFIADINSFYCNDRNRDNTKRLFYVMVARAIDRVILLKQRGEDCAVDSILPVDESILERN